MVVRACCPLAGGGYIPNPYRPLMLSFGEARPSGQQGREPCASRVAACGAGDGAGLRRERVSAGLLGGAAARDQGPAGAGAAELGLVLLAAGDRVAAVDAVQRTWCRRFGSRLVVAGTTLAASGILAALVGVPSLLAVGLILFVWGSCYGSWDVAMNVHGSAVEQHAGREWMPRLPRLLERRRHRRGRLRGAGRGGRGAASPALRRRRRRGTLGATRSARAASPPTCRLSAPTSRRAPASR